MRKRKTEDIRRIVSAAASMCDLSSLGRVKKKLAEAIRELDSLESKRTSERNNAEVKRPNMRNPLSALRAIEEEIRKEKGKNSGGEERELFNG